MRIWFFLRPTVAKLVILAIIMLVTLLGAIQSEATSKVTWNESHGAPLPFLTLIRYQGPCPPLDFCTNVSIQSIDPIAMLFDGLCWYFVACVLAWGYTRIARRRS
jgi:hypothetical protein